MSAPQAGQWSRYIGFVILIGAFLSLLIWWRTLRLIPPVLAYEQRLQAESERWRAQVEAAYRFRARQHDFRNQIAVLSALLQMGATDRALAYLRKAFPAGEFSEIPEGTGEGSGERAVLPRPAGIPEGKGVPVAASEEERLGSDDPHSGLDSVFALILTKKGRAWRQGIRFRMHVELDEYVHVPMDPVFIRVLSHLVENALDAVGEAEAGRREVELRFIWTSRNALVEVWNSGPPISPMDMERIFQPGFSTKGREYWGLGLSEVWQWVTAKGGELRVETEPGRGTRFVLRYPVADAAASGPR